MALGTLTAAAVSGAGGGKTAGTVAASTLAAAKTAAPYVSAGGALLTGIAGNNQMKFQAAQQRQQAERERRIAEQESEDLYRRNRRLLARARATRAASGVSMEGTPLLIDEETVEEAALNELRVRRGGQARATQLENSATLSRTAGRNRLVGSFFRAGKSLLGAIDEPSYAN